MIVSKIQKLQLFHAGLITLSSCVYFTVIVLVDLDAYNRDKNSRFSRTAIEHFPD